MQIISGLYKGHSLKSKPNVRPTMSCVREAIFSILSHNKLYSSILQGAYVLDLFCGSGAIGLEALSYGARHIFMIDIDVTSVQYNSLPFKKEVTIIRADATNPPIANKPCDLIFIDPPYDSDNYETILHNLVRAQWVKYGALVILEVRSEEQCCDFQQYQLTDERKYSKTKVLILRFMPYNISELRKLVLDEFSDAEVLVEDIVGDSNHFYLTITSGRFRGRSMLEQHRMVYSALQGKVGNDIHALKLKTIIKE